MTVIDIARNTNGEFLKPFPTKLGKYGIDLFRSYDLHSKAYINDMHTFEDTARLEISFHQQKSPGMLRASRNW